MKKAFCSNKFVSLVLVFAVLLLLIPTEIKAATVKLNESSVTMYKYMQVQLKLEGASSVSWNSSNKKVAKVSQKGVVTGVKKGSCKITATNKKTGKKYSCKVVVQDVPTRDQSVKKGSTGYTSFGVEFPIVSKFNRIPLINDGYLDLYDLGKNWWGADTDVNSFSYQMLCSGKDNAHSHGNHSTVYYEVSELYTFWIGTKYTVLQTLDTKLQAVPEEGVYYFFYLVDVTDSSDNGRTSRDNTLLLLANITSTPFEVEQALFEDAFTDDEHFSKDKWVTIGDCKIQFVYAQDSYVCYKIKEA